MKLTTVGFTAKEVESPPVRGAWIETWEKAVKGDGCWVAPRAGGVD